MLHAVVDHLYVILESMNTFSGENKMDIDSLKSFPVINGKSWIPIAL